MTRISRIRAPRATVVAFALLVVVMLGFGVFAEVAPDEPTVVAQQEPSEGTSSVSDWLRLCRL